MLNIEKSEAPRSSFNYDDIDIIEHIREDFYVLCYICEEYTPKHFEIDHFFPQKYFPKLENNWDNLFYVCQKCNKIRPKDINTTGKKVLNNCKDNLENIIKLEYNFSTNKISITTKVNNEKVINTINLLNKIYNGIGTDSKSYIYVREEIKKELEGFKDLLLKYEKATDLFENSIKNRLSKKTRTEKSKYVSFKRQFVKNDKNLNEKFAKYFD